METSIIFLYVRKQAEFTKITSRTPLEIYLFLGDIENIKEEFEREYENDKTFSSVTFKKILFQTPIQPETLVQILLFLEDDEEKWGQVLFLLCVGR